MKKDDLKERVISFLHTNIDFFHSYTIHPYYLTPENTIEIFKAESEPNADLWYQIVKEKERIIIPFTSPQEPEKLITCIDHIERPINDYEYDNIKIEYMGDIIAFSLEINDCITALSGVVSGSDWPEYFIPKKLHPDWINAFTLITKEYFSISYLNYGQSSE